MDLAETVGQGPIVVSVSPLVAGWKNLPVPAVIEQATILEIKTLVIFPWWN